MSEEEPNSIPLSELRSAVDGEDREDDADAAGDERDSVPLSGLKDAISRDRRERAESEAFLEEDVDPVDSEGIWADLLMDEPEPGQFSPVGGDGETQVISKRICERCPHVADPPELSCTHEGTTIHELVDVDHVRVSACPMVGPEGEKRTPDVD